MTKWLLIVPFVFQQVHALELWVVPQQATSKIMRTWMPLAAALSEATGENIKIRTTKNIPEFEKKLAEGVPDFFYGNPLQFVKAVRDHKYMALAREKGKKLKGIIVVGKESKLKKLDQLNGKKGSFPRGAFAANKIPQAQLLKLSIQFEKQVQQSHDSSYGAVVRSKADFSGGVNRTFSALPQGVRDKLEKIWESEAYPAHAFASHPRVSSKVAEKVRAALIGLAKNKKKVLETLGFKELESTKNEDYSSVSALFL